MPHLPFANNTASEDDAQDAALKLPENEPRTRKNSVLGRIQRIQNWFRDDDSAPCEPLPGEQEQEHREEASSQFEEKPTRRPSLLGRRGHRRVVPELPRPLTFRRQNSEKRERLLPVPIEPERRAVSADRRPRAISRTGRGSPPLTPLPSLSAPEVGTPIRHAIFETSEILDGALDLEDSHWPEPIPYEPLDFSQLDGSPPILGEDSHSDALDERELQAELESKWILNLSMHFRDKSDREKFFVTYAQEPNQWRRVTVSLDYRDAEQESLEADLKSLHYQRDKSARIYAAVRESLPDIQFFETVTNLKLQTDDGRLHVHVTEDVNEIISYPRTPLVDHINCQRYRESELEFDAHLSGFVYRVRVDDRIWVKKEIPGPDSVEEFLYEINALDALQGSQSVIGFHGLVVNEDCSLVKGLLISFAARSSLVDMLYDFKETDQLPWELRQRWAYQIVEGLSEIHEAGFVQGDFTLSNIVIDGNDDAKIIDINRRGCPIGWEPPELINLIHSGQAIKMCIGVKSDLFQLGMVLWALSEKNDEPEQVERVDSRLPPAADEETPLWFKRIIETCLSERPRDRTSAKELLRRFPALPPPEPSADTGDSRLSDHSIRSRRSDKQYIDPAAAVHLEDIEEHRREQSTVPRSHLTSEPYTFVGASTNYRYQSDGSYIVADGEVQELPRRRRSSPYVRALSSATSVSSRSETGPRPRRPTYEYMCPDDEVVVPARRRVNAHVSSSGPNQEQFEDRPHPSEGMRGRTDKSTRFASERDGTDECQHDRVHFSPPSHQDSGFDEAMIAGIESSQQSMVGHTRSQMLTQEDRSLDTDQLVLDTVILPSHVQPTASTSGCPPPDAAPLNHNITPTPSQVISADSVELPPTAEICSIQSPHEPATPLSFHTPLATPLDGVAADDPFTRPDAAMKPAPSMDSPAGA